MRAGVLLALMLLAAPSHAQREDSTFPTAAPDRSGGVYRVALDPHGLWVWHVRGDGSPAVGYATAQLVDSTHQAGWPTLAGDGFGGALLSFRAVEDTTGQVRTLRIANGRAPAPGWAFGGALAAATPVGGGYHGLTPDLEGGLYCAWQDFRTSYDDQDIVVQRMSSLAGVADGWPAGGVFACDAPNNQYDPVLAYDPGGGVFVAWWDARALGTGNDTGFDIWAQSIGPDGTVRWAADGVPVTRRAGHQVLPTIARDGQGGILVAWSEESTTYPNAGYGRVGMQRLNAGGTLASGWPGDGVLLGDGQLTHTGSNAPSLVADGTGGAYTMWAEGPAGSPPTGPWTVRVQHVASNGVIAPGWPLSGAALAVSSGPPLFPVGLVSDDAGGVIGAWLELVDENTNTVRIRSQRLRPAGGPAAGWPGPGAIIAEEPMDYDIAMVKDFSGGATLSWYPFSAVPGSLRAPRARRVTHDGVVDPYWGGYPYADGQPVASPNPSPGAVTITFALPRVSPIEARVYDVAGREVRRLARIAESAAGQRSIAWDGRDDDGEAVRAGLYFVRLRWSERDHTARVVIAR